MAIFCGVPNFRIFTVYGLAPGTIRLTDYRDHGSDSKHYTSCS